MHPHPAPRRETVGMGMARKWGGGWRAQQSKARQARMVSYPTFLAAKNWLNSAESDQAKFPKPAGVGRDFWLPILDAAVIGGFGGTAYVSYLAAKIDGLIAEGNLPAWDAPVYEGSAQTLRGFLAAKNGYFAQ